jgi:hypothetical protein
MKAVYKAEQVLWFIGEAGSYGKSYSEIQEFICRLNGLDWNEKAWNGRRKNRGIWSTNLSCSYSGGLLYRFCAKLAGRWVLVRPVPMGNFYDDVKHPRNCQSDRKLGPTLWNKDLPTASEYGKRLFGY